MGLRVHLCTNASGTHFKVGLASGGKDYCPDLKQPCRTIVGTFTAYRESGPECVSNEFPVGKSGAPMPDCIFIINLIPLNLYTSGSTLKLI